MKNCCVFVICLLGLNFPLFGGFAIEKSSPDSSEEIISLADCADFQLIQTDFERELKQLESKRINRFFLDMTVVHSYIEGGCLSPEQLLKYENYLCEIETNLYDFVAFSETAFQDFNQSLRNFQNDLPLQQKLIQQQKNFQSLCASFNWNNEFCLNQNIKILAKDPDFQTVIQQISDEKVCLYQSVMDFPQVPYYFEVHVYEYYRKKHPAYALSE